MAFPTKDILGILVDNLRKRRSVLPLSRRKAIRWADGLEIPEGGGTVIYTGLMYQLMSSVVALEKMTMRFEDTWIRHFSRLGRMVNRAVDVSSVMTVRDYDGRRYFDSLLRNIVCLLRKTHLEFGYLYDNELYTGALIHDQGVCDAFEEHACKVYRLLKENRVRRVITVDPHTTDMLRTVYPRIIDDYDIEVTNYLELLARMAPEPVRKLDRDVVIHDSCVYARYESIIEEPRLLLGKAGLDIREHEYTKKMTYCCGGPIESLFPKKSRAIADNRVDQLKDRSRNIVTMCPICLINLRHAALGTDVSVEDISQYLVEAYCDDVQPAP